MEKLNNANKKLKTAHESIERDYNTQIYELNYKENELLKRMSDLDAKKLDIAKEHGSTNISDDDVLEINAGGKIIVAKRFTLTQLEGTRLSALFSGRWDKKLQRDSHGRIFLDVNPICFQAVVDYLNELLISSEENLPKLPCVDEEHEHIMEHQIELFGLHRGVPGSEIVNKRHKDRIHEWLKEDVSDGELTLLYRRTRDGMDGKDFHSKCDNKGPTFTIIETTSGIIMGGYTNTQWGTTNMEYFGAGYQRANKAFLFVLTGIDNNNGNDSPPYKIKLRDPINHKCAIYHDKDCGPTFGGGHDLFVNRNEVTLRVGHTYDGDLSGEYNIKEIEVYQVKENTDTPNEEEGKPSAKISKVVRFSEDINEAINTKIKSLAELESEINDLEDSFNDEKSFITTFTSGEAKDIVTLNVSGTTMVTKRSTLCTAEESSLAQQFDDTKWTEQGCNNLRVKEWTPNDVCDWAKKIDDISDEVAQIFVENEITGNELLALTIDGLKMIGIERAGTVCLLLKEIKSLEKASQDVVTLIEHSPYCFGKILDYLRMKQTHSEGLVSKPPALPRVWDSQKEKFRKVVQYFFPGDCAKLILGD